jgi:hypothetical protein
VIAKFLRFAAGDDDVTATDMPELQAIEKWERYIEERSSGGGGI